MSKKTNLAEVFHQYPELSLRKVALATELNYNMLLKQGKKPILGVPYDPELINFPAVEGYMRKKLGEGFEDINWQDIAELDDPEERTMFLADLGIEKSGLDRLIQCSYDLLGLISFLTYGKDECRAWTIRKGTKAPQAAGKIHSDIERGFIRAETINFDEMMACGGSVAAAKEKGLLRSEGKEYVVKDGDMIYFRFNV